MGRALYRKPYCVSQSSRHVISTCVNSDFLVPREQHLNSCFLPARDMQKCQDPCAIVLQIRAARLVKDYLCSEVYVLLT